MEGEQLRYWLEIAEVGLIASVKFLLAPFDAERNHFNFWEAFTITTTGGFIGILAFYFAGANINNWWRHLMALIKSVFSRKSITEIESTPKRNFTRGRRFIVKTKNKFGLVGIAFITPCLISIPIGTVVATHFFRKRKPVILYLTISLVLWSLVLNGLAQILRLSQYIPHLEK
jgi:hypothetical protein